MSRLKAPLPRAPNDPLKDSSHYVGPTWLGLYRNSDDPRLFVSRRRPWLGRTINLGHPHACWFIAATVFLLLVGITLKLAGR